MYDLFHAKIYKLVLMIWKAFHNIKHSSGANAQGSLPETLTLQTTNKPYRKELKNNWKKNKEGEKKKKKKETQAAGVNQSLLLNRSWFCVQCKLTLMNSFWWFTRFYYQPPEGESSLHAFTYSITTILSYTRHSRTRSLLHDWRAPYWKQVWLPASSPDIHSMLSIHTVLHSKAWAHSPWTYMGILFSYAYKAWWW